MEHVSLIENLYLDLSSEPGRTLTRENVSVQWQQGEVERGVGDARIWFEDCKDAEKAYDDEKRLLPESEAQSTHV